MENEDAGNKDVAQVEAGAQGAGTPESQDVPGVVVELARYPGSTPLTLEAVCRIFRRSPKSVRRAVRSGQLPPGIRVFGKMTWTAGSILQHLQNRLDRAQREAERMQRKVAELAP
jgi:hypothetical protein